MALSNRSKLYLRKLKAQQGLQVPYIDPSSNDMFRDYYSINAPNNVANMQNIQPNLQAAKQATIIRDNPETRGKVGLNMYSKNNSVNIPSMNVPTSKGQYVGGGYGENDATDFADSLGESGLPFVSGWFTSVNGIRDMIYSYEDEDRQKAYEKSTREDLKQRKDQARANNFYFTPYTTGRTYKNGGKVKYQGGGTTNSIDSFMNYYNKQQDASKQSLDSLEEYYRSKNNFMRDQWNARRTKGLSNHIMGGIDSFMDYWTYGADGQSMNAGTLDEAQASLDTGQNPTAMAMQKGGYLPTVTNDSGIISTATPVISVNNKTIEQSDTMKRLDRAFYNIDTEKEVKLASEWMKLDPYQRQYYGKLKAGIPIKEYEDARPTPQHKKFRYREKQEGGDIDILPQDDLYSEQFQSPYQHDEQESEQLQNKIYTDNPGMSFENNKGLFEWLFGEEPIETHTISDIYDSQYSNSNNENVSFIGNTSGTEILKGDIASSHLNPGNIKYGKFASKYGAQPGRAAKDGGVFAKFPSVQAGLQAQKDLLTSGSYANLTVADAMRRWSNNGYGADLFPQIANKRMNELTPDELNQLVLKQTKRESPTIYKQIYGNG